MSLMTLMVLAIVVGGLLIAALVVGIIVLAGRARPQPGLGSVSQTAPAQTAPGEGAWNAEIGGGGVLGGATYGVVTVSRGMLSLTPEGATAPTWSVPCAHVAAWKQAGGMFAVSTVGLHGPMGQVDLTVSREHINRFMTNDLKQMRRGADADEFLRCLAACGARVRP